MSHFWLKLLLTFGFIIDETQCAPSATDQCRIAFTEKATFCQVSLNEDYSHKYDPSSKKVSTNQFRTMLRVCARTLCVGPQQVISLALQLDMEPSMGPFVDKDK